MYLYILINIVLWFYRKDDSLSTCLSSDYDISEFETVNVSYSSVHYDISDDEVLDDGFVNIVQLQKDDG